MAKLKVEMLPAKKLNIGSLKYPEEKLTIPPTATNIFDTVSNTCPESFQHFLFLINVGSSMNDFPKIAKLVAVFTLIFKIPSKTVSE